MSGNAILFTWIFVWVRARSDEEEKNVFLITPCLAQLLDSVMSLHYIYFHFVEDRQNKFIGSLSIWLP